MVKLTGDPVQVTPSPVYKGVTEMVAVTVVAVVLVALKAPILPEPLAANPIDGSEFVHSYVVPLPVNVTAAVFDPLHTT